MSDIQIAEPGDEIHVVESPESTPETVIEDVEGDANDTDVVVDDDSYNSQTDESVNVNVTVEAPEVDNAPDSTATILNVLNDISNKLDGVVAATTVSAIADIEESNNDDRPDSVEEVDVIETNGKGESAAPDLKDVEPETPKRTRRFGR